MAYYEIQTIKYSDDYDIPNLANCIRYCYEHFLRKEMPQVDDLSKEFTLPIMDAREIGNDIALLSEDEFSEFTRLFSSPHEQQEFIEFIEVVGAEHTLYKDSVKVSPYNM